MAKFTSREKSWSTEMKRVEVPLIGFLQCDGARVCNLDRTHVGAGEGQVVSPVCLRSIHIGKLCLRHRNLAPSCVWASIAPVTWHKAIEPTRSASDHKSSGRERCDPVYSVVAGPPGGKSKTDIIHSPILNHETKTPRPPSTARFALGHPIFFLLSITSFVGLFGSTESSLPISASSHRCSFSRRTFMPGDTKTRGVYLPNFIGSSSEDN
jgi:hypothetical protein